MNIKNNKVNLVLDFAAIILMAVLLAFNYRLFIVGNDFAPAGINGIATMIQYKLGFSIGYFSLIINIPMCIFAFFKVNRGFACRSFTFTLVYSVSYILLGMLNLEPFKYICSNGDVIFPCIIAGVLNGMCYGVCFGRNASTGGMDIFAKYISKVKPNLNFFFVVFTINSIVACASFFVYAKVDPTTGLVGYNYQPVCLCIIYCFISTFIGNIMLKGSKSAYNFIIITSHAQEINEDIINKLKHGATEISAHGVYSHLDKQVLMCVVNKHQLVDFKNILKKYDETFAFVENVSETIGNFKVIK